MQSRGKTPSCCCFVAPIDKPGSLSQLCTFSRQSHQIRWNRERYIERGRRRDAPAELKAVARKMKCSTDRSLETKRWCSRLAQTQRACALIINSFTHHRVFRPPTQQGPTSRRESLCFPLSSTTNTSWSRSSTPWSSKKTLLCETGKSITLEQNISNSYNPTG